MMTPQQSDHYIEQLAQAAVFDGWSVSVMSAVAKELELEPAFVFEAFATPLDAIDAHSRLGDRRLKQFVEDDGLEGVEGVKAKLHHLIMQRFEQAQPVKEAIRKAVAQLNMPPNQLRASKATLATCDLLWRLVEGDATDSRSTPSFYSKRGLLAGVYVSSLFAWLDDDDPQMEKTSGFVAARLDNVTNTFGLVRKVGDKLAALFRR